MTEEARHSVAVAAVVLDEQDRVLLMKRRDHDNWEPPGGVLRTGEQPDEGARREVREETGVEIDLGPLRGVYANVEEVVISLVFRATARTPARKSSEEAAEIRWAPGAEAEALLNGDYRQWLEDALNDDPVEVRVQHSTVKGASATAS
jgi:8-oxo-dGTP diphosphatase